MYLLDTNVVSELRRVGTSKADPSVSKWAKEVDAKLLHLSVITVLELELGVVQRERRDPSQGAMLRDWLETQVVPAFEGRIFPVDLAIARCCARLHSPDPRPERDALIAATSLIHGLTVVTRNIKDFRSIGVKLLNPWAEP